MGGFSYGQHTRKRIGVWLKWEFCADVLLAIKKSGNKRFYDSVRRVVVEEYLKDTDEVWLSVYCASIFDTIRNKNRYNLFYIKIKVNEFWACHTDLGTGMK